MCGVFFVADVANAADNRLEQGKSAFSKGRNLAKRMKRSMRGFLHWH